MQTINVPGVGSLQFPDGMADADMAAAIQKNYPQIHTPTDASSPYLGAAKAMATAAPLQSIGSLETAAHLGTGALGGLGGGLGYLGTLVGTLGDTDAAKSVQESMQKTLTYEPRTKAGKDLSAAADKALGYIPQALNKAGEVTADATGSPLLGTAVNVGGNALLSLLPMKGASKNFTTIAGERAASDAAAVAQAATPKAIPTTPSELVNQSLGTGKDVGYQVTPNYDPTASFIDRLGQGVAGKNQTEQGARVQNQGVTNALAARAVGQDPASLITTQSLQAIRNQAVRQGYEPIAQLQGKIPVDEPFIKENSAIQSLHGDELSGNPDVVATANILNKDNFDPATITDQISTLRGRAQDAFAAQRSAAGTAFRKQAASLEALLDRHLQSAEDVPSGMLDRYRAARQLIAKTHDVEKTLNPSTGNVDAIGIGQALKNGTPLTGDLKTIADFANSAGGISSVPQGAPLPTSPFNTLAGAAAAHGTGGASLAMIPAARAFAARWLVRRNDNPSLLQPAGGTYGQATLDAIHGNTAAFSHMYEKGAPAGILGDQSPQ